MSNVELVNQAFIKSKQQHQKQVDQKLKDYWATSMEKPRKSQLPVWVRAFDNRKEFIENCTLHGVRYILLSNAFIIRKLLWLILVLLCMGIMSYQIIDRVIYYYSWPVTVNVDVNYNKTLLFPSVTICNQNSFKATKATELGRYRLLENLYNNVRYMNSTEVERYGFNNMSTEELFRDVAHQKEEMIISCMWGSERCTSDNFTQIYTDHGVCYTYSQRHGENKYRKVLSTGSENGLRLILNVEQYEYMPGPNTAAGIKILMHNEDEFPKVHELGLATPTGAHAFVGLKIVSLSNLPKPRGMCSSRELEYFPTYSPENCELDCFTIRMNEVCQCRLSYMPHKNGYPPVCTLQQHQDCYVPKKAQMRYHVRTTCVCPVPCKSLLFEPTVSYATTSTFAAQTLKSEILGSGVQEDFYHAREVTNRMQGNIFDKTKNFLLKFEKSFNVIKNLFDHDLSESIKSQLDTLGRIYNSTKKDWERKNFMNQFQIYVTEKNFIRGREAMEERTLKYLGFDYISFTYRMGEQIKSLVKPEIAQKNLKEMIYFLINRDCMDHLEKGNKALQNYTELLNAFRTGIPIFRYKFRNVSRSHNYYIVPRPLFNKSLTYSNYSVKYSKKVSFWIENIMKYLNKYIEIANETYTTGKLNMTNLDLVTFKYGKACKNYNFAKSAFYYYCIDWALEEVRNKELRFQTLWNDYENVAKDIRLNLNNINSMLSSLNTDLISSLETSISLANGYLNNTVTKRELASTLNTHKTEQGVNNLQTFFTEIRSRETLLFDDWKKLSQASIAIWKSILNDEDCFQYYNLTNDTEFMRDPNDKAIEIDNVYEEIRVNNHFRTLIGNKDRTLIHDIKNVMEDMFQFQESLKIDNKFMRDNILELAIFYRELSYEEIEHQVGYYFFSLLCDIGGSMGLFLGASVLTIFEIAEFFFGQSVRAAFHGRNSK